MSTVMSVRPGQPRCRIAPAALNLIESARRGLADAESEASPGTRYVGAHLAALRAAAAIVAVKMGPGQSPRRKAPHSVWELLPRVEPALSEWAAFFAAGAGKRAAAEAGLLRAVSAREADDLLRDAETFLTWPRKRWGCRASRPCPSARRARRRPAAQVLAGPRARASPGTPAACQPVAGRPPKGATLGQKASTAPRASESRTPQLISSSVRSIGDLS